MEISAKQIAKLSADQVQHQQTIQNNHAAYVSGVETMKKSLSADANLQLQAQAENFKLQMQDLLGHNQLLAGSQPAFEAHLKSVSRGPFYVI